MKRKKGNGENVRKKKKKKRRKEIDEYVDRQIEWEDTISMRRREIKKKERRREWEVVEGWGREGEDTKSSHLSLRPRALLPHSLPSPLLIPHTPISLSGPSLPIPLYPQIFSLPILHFTLSSPKPPSSSSLYFILSISPFLHPPFSSFSFSGPVLFFSLSPSLSFYRTPTSFFLLPPIPSSPIRLPLHPCSPLPLPSSFILHPSPKSPFSPFPLFGHRQIQHLIYDTCFTDDYTFTLHGLWPLMVSRKGWLSLYCVCERRWKEKSDDNVDKWERRVFECANVRVCVCLRV